MLRSISYVRLSTKTLSVLVRICHLDTTWRVRLYAGQHTPPVPKLLPITFSMLGRSSDPNYYVGSICGAPTNRPTPRVEFPPAQKTLICQSLGKDNPPSRVLRNTTGVVRSRTVGATLSLPREPGARAAEGVVGFASKVEGV